MKSTSGREETMEVYAQLYDLRIRLMTADSKLRNSITNGDGRYTAVVAFELFLEACTEIQGALNSVESAIKSLEDDGEKQRQELERVQRAREENAADHEDRESTPF